MNTKTIQFTAAKGPAECSYVVAKVLKKCLAECKKNNIDYTLLNKQKGVHNGTLLSVTLQLRGKGLNRFVRSWVGTIQWIGKSTFRKNHKRKNWFIGCFLLEDVKPFNLKESDIRYQAMRSSGPGGQHVNKVSSAVRATHIPSNIQVVAMDSRSQHQNKKWARQRLLEKVEEQYYKTIAQKLEKEWANHYRVERGNPVRVFRGNDFKRKPAKKKYKQKRNQEKQNWRNETNDY